MRPGFMSTRETLLQVQRKLNAMPLHQLGAMLAIADRMRRGTDTDQAIGQTLYAQVLLAMRPECDHARSTT